MIPDNEDKTSLPQTGDFSMKVWKKTNKNYTVRKSIIEKFPKHKVIRNWCWIRWTQAKIKWCTIFASLLGTVTVHKDVINSILPSSWEKGKYDFEYLMLHSEFDSVTTQASKTWLKSLVLFLVLTQRSVESFSLNRLLHD